MAKKSSKSKVDQEEEKPVIEKKASIKVEKSPKKEKRSEKDKTAEKSPKKKSKSAEKSPKKKSKSAEKSPKKDKTAKKAEKAERKAKKAEKRARAVQEESEVADDDDQSEAVFEADGDTDSIFSSEVTQPSETPDIDLAALLKAHEQSKREGRKQQSQKMKKKGARTNDEEDEEEEEEEDDDDNNNNDDDEEEEEGEGEKKTKKKSQKTVLAEQQEERTRRTLFLGNLPVETKPNQVKRLFDSLKAAPTQRIIESVRFRSFATAKANSNRKLAFIKKEFHSKRGSLNAYVVFVTEELARQGLDVIQKADPPVMMAANRIRADLATPPSGLVAAGVSSTPAVEQPRQQQLTLFVGNVPFECEDDWMIQHFVRAGAMVESVRLIRDGATGLGKGFGYVTFKQDTDIEIALRTKDKPFKIPNSDHTRLLRILTCKPSRQSAATAGRLLDDNRKSGSRTVDEAQRRKLKKLKDTHLKKKEAKDQTRRAEARDRRDQPSEDRGRKRFERSDDNRGSRKRFERSERSSSRSERPAALFPWQGESAVLGEKDVLAHRKPKKSGGKKPRRK